MKEPRRLSQSGGVSQRLLDSASLDKPGPAARRHAAALASTASSFARTSSANSGARVRPPNAAKTLATWIVVGAAASVALGLVGSRLLPSAGAPQAAASLATLPTLAAPVAARAPEISAEPVLSADRPSAPSPDEIGAIEAARAAVSRGDAASAIAQLNHFDASHPHEQLKPEALALRIRALGISGKRTEARALEDDFRAKYPNRPLPSAATSVAR